MQELNRDWQIVRFPKRKATVILSLVSYATITIYDDESAAYFTTDISDKMKVERFSNINIAFTLLQKIDEIERKKEQ